MLKNSERFFKVYSTLPIEERKNPIIVINNEPISWQLAHEEVNNQTKRGEKIIKLLIE
tara:strand:- start:886 stop:1059 length:174 start_codon:yes stop_codon:yes gene_type:complete